MGNSVKTVLLMGLLMGLCLAVGETMGGSRGLLTAFVFGGLGNLVMYWFSDRVVLWMNGAQPVEPGDLPQVYRIVADLAAGAGIPIPKMYLIQSPLPNAFATGRNPAHAAVAVTTGILDVLDERELRGVLAHELSHVLHRDILISTIAAVMAGAIMVLSRMAYYAAIFGGRRDDRERGGNPLAALAMMIFAPLAASLIQLAISRSREYQADEGGAKLSGDPLALASALGKIERAALAGRGGFAQMNQTTAHLYIVNPFSLEGISRLFSTHPPTEDRIERLEAMAGVPSSKRLRP